MTISINIDHISLHLSSVIDHLYLPSQQHRHPKPPSGCSCSMRMGVVTIKMSRGGKEVLQVMEVGLCIWLFLAIGVNTTTPLVICRPLFVWSINLTKTEFRSISQFGVIRNGGTGLDEWIHFLNFSRRFKSRKQTSVHCVMS